MTLFLAFVFGAIACISTLLYFNLKDKYESCEQKYAQRGKDIELLLKKLGHCNQENEQYEVLKIHHKFIKTNYENLTVTATRYKKERDLSEERLKVLLDIFEHINLPSI